MTLETPPSAEPSRIDVGIDGPVLADTDGSGPGLVPVRTHKSVFRRLLGNRGSAIAGGFLLLLAISALFAPLLARHDPNEQDLLNVLQSPSGEFLLGTDNKGRDVFSRILFAGRVALMAPLLAVTVGVVLGVPAGLLAGTVRGRIDRVMGRLADAILSIPPLVLALAIVAILGPGLTNAMLAIGIVYAPRLFRVTRGATMSVSEELYVDASRSIGCSTPRLLWAHILPNIAGPLLVQITLMMGFSLLAEATLSFLGLGIQIPNASWGSMLRDAYQDKFRAPYAVVPPGIAMTLTILAFNTLGDGLRDVVTARRRQ
ncbi:MAG: ABC transporter permease [Acidimicrobiales bacterium]